MAGAKEHPKVLFTKNWMPQEHYFIGHLQSQAPSQPWSYKLAMVRGGIQAYLLVFQKFPPMSGQKPLQAQVAAPVSPAQLLRISCGTKKERDAVARGQASGALKTNEIYNI